MIAVPYPVTKKKWCYTLLGTTMTRGEISDDDNDVRVPELGVFFSL